MLRVRRCHSYWPACYLFNCFWPRSRSFITDQGHRDHPVRRHHAIQPKDSKANRLALALAAILAVDPCLDERVVRAALFLYGVMAMTIR